MRNRIILSALATLTLSICATGVRGQDTYSVPDGLGPVSSWRDGFSAAEAGRFRTDYSATDFWSGTDGTVFTYLNIPQVLNTMTVARGGPVSELVEAPMDAIGEVEATTQLGTMTLNDALVDTRSRLQGIVVVHRGQIVFEAYPGMQPFQSHSWNSAAKPILGLITHQLVEEGLVDLDKTVADYLPYTSSYPVGAVRVRDVLHHRTGLDYEETNASIADPTHPIGFGFAGALAGRNEPIGLSTRDALTRVGVLRPPGSAFQYSSYNTQILGLIAEAVTGQPLNEIISARIWRKAGMEGDALLGLSAAGEPLAAGVFASRLRDFARFGLLFTPSASVVSRVPVVPEGYLEDVYAAVDPEVYLEGVQGNRMVEGFGLEGAPYGSAYQWDAVFEDGDLFKPGINGQALYVSPQTDTVIVYFSTTFANSLYLIAYPRAIVNALFRR